MNRQWNVLLVEDNAADAELLITLLRYANFLEPIYWVHDGEEALRFLEQTMEHQNAPEPKTILLDLALPRLNGLEVLQSVREKEKTKDSPVIILTTSKSPEDISRCHALGIESYLTKPIDLDEFEQLVGRLTNVEFPKLGWASHAV